MNLHNLSDQEFDRELRKHLYDPNIPFDPASWDKMSIKLDLFAGTNHRNNGGALGLSLLALLLAGVFFLGVASFPLSMNQLYDDREAPPLVSGQQLLPDKSIKQPSSQTSKSQKDLNTTEIPDQISSDHLADPAKSNSEQVREDHQPTYTVVKPTEEHGQTKFHGNPTLTSNGARELAVENEFPGNIQHVDSTSTISPPVVKESSGSPWFTGFGYAPDISLVGSGDMSSPGTNWIFSLERRLGTRWSIQSGVIFSSKKYKANGEDYHPPEDFWGYGKVPDEMDAKCKVLDIPVNLRYYFKPGNRHQFYASTGLSSYLMLSEDYYYHYDYYGYPHSVNSWSVKNENQHFFGIYNFSAGYQRNLGKQWYLEIEPFIKVPLSGVGFGKVDLWSTGSMFSLKYNFR